MCRVSVLFSALYAQCPYYVVLYMQTLGIEPRNMGSSVSAVYTPEQQARLGVDAYGGAKAGAAAYAGAEYAEWPVEYEDEAAAARPPPPPRRQRPLFPHLCILVRRLLPSVLRKSDQMG